MRAASIDNLPSGTTVSRTADLSGATVTDRLLTFYNVRTSRLNSPFGSFCAGSVELVLWLRHSPTCDFAVTIWASSQDCASQITA